MSPPADTCQPRTPVVGFHLATTLAALPVPANSAEASSLQVTPSIGLTVLANAGPTTEPSAGATLPRYARGTPARVVKEPATASFVPSGLIASAFTEPLVAPVNAGTRAPVAASSSARWVWACPSTRVKPPPA